MHISSFNIFFGVINLFLAIIIFGIIIYSFILFVKLANRGIKALDIYINKNNNNKL